MQCSVSSDVKWTKRGIFQQKTLKKNAVVIKSTLDSNCNRSRDTAIRENFNVKPETQMKKTHSHNRGNYIHQYNEVKDKM